jgi:putative transposase
MLLRGYKYKLRLTTRQKKVLSRWLGACRFVFNCGLIHRILSYQQWRKSVSYYEQQNSLPDAKQEPELEWLKEVPSQSLQVALRNLDTAFKNFFRGIGKFPQPKKKGVHDSISFPQGNMLRIQRKSKKRSKILLPKLGEVEFIHHRRFTGKVKSATVSYSHGDGWQISILVVEENIESQNTSADTIGIDLGVVKTIALSGENGELNLPLEQIKPIEKRIQKLQRKRAKLEKSSYHLKKRKRLGLIAAKLHSRIARIRRDFLHKASHKLSKNHGVIVMEDLRVKNMSKSARGTLEEPGKNVTQKSGLNRAILRQGWGSFRIMMEYKTQWYGSRLLLVNPKNTSRRCSLCSFTHESNRQTQAEFSCQRCGYNENADKNAANNIRRLGLESLGPSLLEAPSIAC